MQHPAGLAASCKIGDIIKLPQAQHHGPVLRYVTHMRNNQPYEVERQLDHSLASLIRRAVSRSWHIERICVDECHAARLVW